MNRRDALLSVAAIAGAGATLQAIEHKPEEKVAFYVLTLGQNYEDPTTEQMARIEDKLQKRLGITVPIAILPAGCELKKCTDIKEIESVRLSKGWWSKLTTWLTQ